jgi:hypothetical protein
VLMRAAGLPKDQATATVEWYCELELGSAPGMVPAGELTLGFRRCRDCAARTGTAVGPPDAMPAYRQSDLAP